MRFVNRVFIPDEQRQIFDSAHPDTVLWALWAGKETAYKIIKKAIPDAPSIPLLYKVGRREGGESNVSFLSANDYIPGIAETPWGEVKIRIFIACDYIHCIGTVDISGEMDSVIWKVDILPPVAEFIPGYESIFLRETIKRHLSLFLNCDPEEIEIRRAEDALGPPFVYLRNKPAGIDISLSHDGKFTAYAFIAAGNNLPSLS